MKKNTIPFFAVVTLVVMSIIFVFICSSNAQEPITVQNSNIAHISLLNRSNYPLKPFHQKLQLTCSNCHGSADESTYEPLSTADCLSCHGSAERVASRTGFMDANQTNPHRSLHDGLDLDCYECHAEHKPSPGNLCQTCHDNTSDWFGPTP